MFSGSLTYLIATSTCCIDVGALKTRTAAEETISFADVPIPDDAEIGTFADMGMVTLRFVACRFGTGCYMIKSFLIKIMYNRTDFTPPGSSKKFSAGSLIALPMDDLIKSDWSKVSLFDVSFL